MNSFYETLEAIGYNNGHVKASNRNGVVHKRSYSNLTSYELGVIFAYQYYSKKQAAGKDLAEIDVKTVSCGSYAEIIKWCHGIDKDEYLLAWNDARESMMAGEQLWISD